MISPDFLLYYEIYGCGCPHPDRLPRGRIGRDHPHRVHDPVMETGPSQPSISRPRRLAVFVLAVPAAFFLFLYSPAASWADIYRWVDGQGTAHFTDDPSSIPSEYRKGSVLMIRESPAAVSPPPAAPPPGPPQVPPAGTTAPALSAEEQAAQDAAREKEKLASEVEQLKAKIDAKEKHIQAVDAKQSLALNPLRNRFVEQADLDLYQKYQAELPADREQLKELESRLQSLK